MRIASLSELGKYRVNQEGSGGNAMSASVARQIEKALKDRDDSSLMDQVKTGKKPAQVVGESQGEASVRLALLAAFGDWHKGGEVVQECMPFTTRRYRADFALPRIRAYVEVDGWNFHGRTKSAHHKDRERSRFFARHNWIGFQVSHGQALHDTSDLIEAIADLMTHRTPVPRDWIHLEKKEHKHGVWWQLLP